MLRQNKPVNPLSGLYGDIQKNADLLNKQFRKVLFKYDSNLIKFFALDKIRQDHLLEQFQGDFSATELSFAMRSDGKELGIDDKNQLNALYRQRAAVYNKAAELNSKLKSINLNVDRLVKAFKYAEKLKLQFLSAEHIPSETETNELERINQKIDLLKEEILTDYAVELKTQQSAYALELMKEGQHIITMINHSDRSSDEINQIYRNASRSIISHDITAEQLISFAENFATHQIKEIHEASANTAATNDQYEVIRKKVKKVKQAKKHEAETLTGAAKEITSPTALVSAEPVTIEAPVTVSNEPYTPIVAQPGYHNEPEFNEFVTMNYGFDDEAHARSVFDELQAKKAEAKAAADALAAKIAAEEAALNIAREPVRALGKIVAAEAAKVAKSIELPPIQQLYIDPITAEITMVDAPKKPSIIEKIKAAFISAANSLNTAITAMIEAIRVELTKKEKPKKADVHANIEANAVDYSSMARSMKTMAENGGETTFNLQKLPADAARLLLVKQAKDFAKYNPVITASAAKEERAEHIAPSL